MGDPYVLDEGLLVGIRPAFEKLMNIVGAQFDHCYIRVGGEAWNFGATNVNREPEINHKLKQEGPPLHCSDYEKEITREDQVCVRKEIIVSWFSSDWGTPADRLNWRPCHNCCHYVEFILRQCDFNWPDPEEIPNKGDGCIAANPLCTD